MKSNKIGRIALAAALAGTVMMSAPVFSLTQNAPTVMASLSSQVGAFDYAAARATIEALRQSGVGSIRVGNETVTLDELLAMIDDAEAGRTNPTDLAAYFDSLGSSTAQAVFLPSQAATPTVPRNRETFPVGSSG